MSATKNTTHSDRYAVAKIIAEKDTVIAMRITIISKCWNTVKLTKGSGVAHNKALKYQVIQFQEGDMKKVLTIANILVLVLTLASCFSGNYMILPLAIAYAMALGSMHGNQNKYFHYITIFLNSFYALGGVIAIGVVVLKKMEYMQASELTIVITMVSLLLLVIPILNVNYTKSRISA